MIKVQIIALSYVNQKFCKDFSGLKSPLVLLWFIAIFFLPKLEWYHAVIDYEDRLKSPYDDIIPAVDDIFE